MKVIKLYLKYQLTLSNVLILLFLLLFYLLTSYILFVTLHAVNQIYYHGRIFSK